MEERTCDLHSATIFNSRLSELESALESEQERIRNFTNILGTFQGADIHTSDLNEVFLKQTIFRLSFPR